MNQVERLLQAVSQTARRAHLRVFLVGGLLRDQQVGRTTQDLDFVVNHSAGRLAERAGSTLRGHPFVLDAERHIYRVVVQKGLLRYHLDFARQQGNTIEQDLARRDFTMNALAAPLNTHVSLARLASTIIDPFQGIADAKRRVIRHIAPTAFREDPLRLLRAIRLGAELQATIHPGTARLIKRDASALRRAAPERIHDELFKLLTVPHSALWWRHMDTWGLLAVLFPELEACRNIARRYYPKGGVLGHSLDAVELLETLCFEQFPVALHPYPPDTTAHKQPRKGNYATMSLFQSYLDQPVGGIFPRRAILKLAELLHDIAKPVTAKRLEGRLRFFGHEEVGAKMANKAMARWRCSREETRLVERMVRHHLRLGNLGHQAQITDRAIFRYFRDLDPEGVGMILVSLADHWSYCTPRTRGKGRDPVERIAKRLLQYYYFRPEVVRPAKLIDGHCVMRTLHIKEGPIVGQLLKAVQDAQAAGQVTTRAQALTYAKQLLASKNFR